MTLTTEEKTELIYLLSALQEHLEGAIRGDQRRLYAPDIERDREDWRKTENWLLRLEAEA